MNVSHSISSLYSQLSDSSSSLSSNLSGLPATASQNSLACSTYVPSDDQLSSSSSSSPFTLSLEQQIYMQLNMHRYQCSKPNLSSSVSHAPLYAINNDNETNQRPITGFNNFAVKNKSRAVALTAACNPRSFVSPLKQVFSTTTFADPLAFLPALTLPLVYSRKVFVGGLPPDIDESKLASIYFKYKVSFKV